MFFPYITGRNFAFRILVEIGLVLWAGLVILRKEYRPKFTPILTAILIFAAIVGIADLFGVNPGNSFWSRFERMEGYMMILHLVAYFVLLITAFRTKKDWMMLFNMFLVTSIFVGSYGVLQILGIKEAIQGGGVRIDGTIGNPTYLAAYLLLTTILTFILLFTASRKIWKYFYSAVIVFNTFILYFAASRGVTIAILVSLPIALALYFFLSKNDSKEVVYRKWALGILAAIVLMPIAFLLVKNQSWVKNSDVLARFANISFSERTVKSRFMIWNMSWQGFKENPILGWGQENYLEVFSKYYNPAMYDQEPWFDRSHNIVFDWLINAGILGLISYIGIFVSLFWTTIRHLHQKTISLKEGVVLLVAPLAYFIQNLFVFDNFNTYVLFFAMLAYVNNLDSTSVPEKEMKLTRSLLGLALGAILIAPVIYFANVKGIIQARGIINSLIATMDQRDALGETLKSFKNTLAIKSFGNAEALEQLGRITKILISQDNVSPEQKMNFSQYAIGELEKYLAEHPKDIRAQLFTGDIYQGLSNLDQSFITKARDKFQAALALSPKKQQILFALTNNYLFNNEIEKAAEIAEVAVAVFPSNLEAQGNKAVIAIINGRNDIAEGVIKEMEKLRVADPRNDILRSVFINQLEKIANVFTRIGDINNAKIIYGLLTGIAPENKEFQKQLEALK